LGKWCVLGASVTTHFKMIAACTDYNKKNFVVLMEISACFEFENQFESERIYTSRKQLKSFIENLPEFLETQC
jgi:hypothetical protein